MQARFMITAVLAVMLAGCNGQNGHGPKETFPQERRDPGIAMGSPGDRWLDTMKFRVVGRGKRDGKPGYEVTYDAPGGATFTLFWSRDNIDFRGASPHYRLDSMPLGEGRLYYPDKLTLQSLPDVYRAVQLIEYDYVKDAKGMITAAEAFAVLAAMGAGGPVPRVPGPRATPSPRAPPVRASVPGAEATQAAKAIDPNKLRHIFGQAKHNLAPLVERFGSQAAAFSAVESATQAAVRAQGLSGIFKVTVEVAGHHIVVRGNVIEGVVHIGTFWIP